MHARGDVVAVRFGEMRYFGVVVELPHDGYPRYRIRLATRDWEDFIEIGALEEEVEAKPEYLRRREEEGW